MSLLQEFGSSYDCTASDNPLSVVRDTAPFDVCSAPNFMQIFMESSTNQYSLPFCISLKSRSRKYLSAGPRALVIFVILRRFSNSNFSRSKLNIKNLSDRSLEELVFSQKIEKYL